MAARPTVGAGPTWRDGEVQHRSLRSRPRTSTGRSASWQASRIGSYPYALDAWLAREFPAVEFERFADDAVVHCTTYRQAQRVLAEIEQRMEQVGLRLHPAKTRVVYCKDSTRRGSHEHTSFTLLGFTFRARAARGKNGKKFTSFLPAVSKDALNKTP